MTITDSESKPRAIIIPPPDIRNVIDRTAQFVANLGAEFEARVKSNEKNNPKFNFLISTDSYNGYYQQKVKDYLDGTADATSTAVSVPTQLKLAQETPRGILEVFEPKEPPAEFDFVADPPSIVSLDLDIIRLTAQFVARNGRQFLTQLMQREQRNYLFDFLRPQHIMFSYFSKLAEQYTKILLPPKDIIERLDKECNNSDLFMNNCKYRVLWDRQQARIKEKEMEAEDKERVAYGQIDWHDFVVVEVVDYQPNELGNFPPPTIPEEVGARAIAEERGDTFVNRWVETKTVSEDEDEEEDDESEEESNIVSTIPQNNDDMGDEDMEVSDDEDGVPAPPPPPPSHPAPQTFKQPSSVTDPTKNALIKPDEVIIKSYDPKTKIKKQVDELHLISPFGDNKKIPESQANKHIHVSLLDPHWRESKVGNVRNRNQDESPYAPGNLVDMNLKTLAERRTDIFGTEETMIGRKLGEESGKKSEKYVWDGQSTVSEAYLKRPAEIKHRGDNAEVANEKNAADLDRIGPQGIPQSLPVSTITVIVNTPIISQAVSNTALEDVSEAKRMKLNE